MTLILVILIVLLVLLFWQSSQEQFADSLYGNISLTSDIDPLLQRQYLSAPKYAPLDNSDVVEQALRGNTIYATRSITNVLPEHESSDYDITLTNQNSIDELMGRAQQYRGTLNERAIEGTVQSTRALYQKYFTAELDENSNRIWWDNTGDELETDFTTYDL